jgi:MFS family permease
LAPAFEKPTSAAVAVSGPAKSAAASSQNDAAGDRDDQHRVAMSGAAGKSVGRTTPQAGAHPARRWWTIALLGLLLAVSFVDRQILALLVNPIGKELRLSDTRLGLLYGAGFGILYSLAGLPLAQWLDRSARIRIVVFGVVAWSCATIAAGFSRDYWALLACRSGVAIGEAVLTPAAVSLIADMFAPDRRTLPTSLYTAVASLMGVGAFALGGAAVDFATRLSPAVGLEPWRLTLVLVGLPGLFLATILAFTGREPDRRQDALDKAPYASVPAAWRYLVAERGVLAPFLGAVALISIAIYAMLSWAVTLMMRGYGLRPAEAGYLFGISLVGVVVGPLITAMIAECLFEGPRALGKAMSLVALILGPASLACFVVARGPFARHLRTEAQPAAWPADEAIVA